MKNVRFSLMLFMTLFLVIASTPEASAQVATYPVRLANSSGTPIPGIYLWMNMFQTNASSTVNTSHFAYTDSSGRAFFPIPTFSNGLCTLKFQDCNNDTTVKYFTVLLASSGPQVNILWCENDSSNCPNPQLELGSGLQVNQPAMFFVANPNALTSCMGSPTYTWTVNGNVVQNGPNSQLYHTFTSSGYHNICVRASGAGQTTLSCDSILVPVTGGCNASQDFTATINVVNGVSRGVFTTLSTVAGAITWTVNGNVAGNNPSLTYDFPTSGTFVVCFRDSVNSSCKKTTCKTFNIPNQTFNVLGKVKANGMCTQDSVFVQLFGIGGNNYFSERIQRGSPVADSCFFFFNEVPVAGTYLMRAVPTGADALQYLPTYFGNTPYWNQAGFVSAILTVGSWPINLVPIFSDSTGTDSGFVQGYVSGLGGIVNGTVGNTSVSVPFLAKRTTIIVRNAQGNPVAATHLNDDGTYIIPNLPYGSYTLNLDNPMITAPAVAFTLSAATPGRQIQSVVGSNGVSGVVKNRSLLSGNNVQVFPNPTANNLTIKGDAVENVVVTDAIGKRHDVIFSDNEVLVKNLKPGLYFLSGKTKTGLSIQTSFVKN